MTTKFNYSKEQFEKDILDIVRKLSVDNWKPDLIIGPARGGLIPAVYLSHFYDVQMAPVCLSLRDFVTKPDDCHIPVKDLSKFKKILVVDDIVDSGATYRYLLEMLHNKFYKDQATSQTNSTDVLDLRSAVLFYNKTNQWDIKVEYFVHEMDKTKEAPWINFPYERWWVC